MSERAVIEFEERSQLDGKPWAISLVRPDGERIALALVSSEGCPETHFVYRDGHGCIDVIEGWRPAIINCNSCGKLLIDDLCECNL